MKHFIGIDNSSLDHKISIINQNGNVKKSFTVKNTYDGFINLEKNIKDISEPLIGFELPHGPLVEFLRDKKYNIYSLNPLKIKRFKESVKVSGNKSDKIDAQAIAEYMLKNINNIHKLVFNSKQIEELKNLSVIHDRMVRDRARHLNKLHYVIREYFPLQELLFSEFGCKTHLKLILAYPTFDKLSQLSNNDITFFLRQNRYCRKAGTEKIIKIIKEHKQLIPQEIVRPYEMEAKLLCSILLALDKNISLNEQRMNEITNNHRLGNIFNSLPGAGKVLSCQVLALFGDNYERFNCYNEAQCLYGTAPMNYQSGTYHKIRMRTACNKNARAILYKYAFASMNHSEWARRYYLKQREKGKSNSVAIRSLSNKWVRIIYKPWKDKLIYKEVKLKNLKSPDAA